MVILSQDKEFIINFDNIEIVEKIRQPNRDNWFVVANTISGAVLYIGMYNSDALASSVINQIYLN